MYEAHSCRTFSTRFFGRFSNVETDFISLAFFSIFRVEGEKPKRARFLIYAHCLVSSSEFETWNRIPLAFFFSFNYELCSMCTDLKFFSGRNVAIAQQHHIIIISGIQKFLSFMKCWNELRKGSLRQVEKQCKERCCTFKSASCNRSFNSYSEALSICSISYISSLFSFLFSSLAVQEFFYLRFGLLSVACARAPFLIQKSPKPIAEEAHQIR